MNSYQQGAPYHDTHSKVIGYLLWIFGFTGSHRFYYGKPITGTIWFFTRDDTDFARDVAAGGQKGMFCYQAKDQKVQACIHGALGIDQDRARIDKYWNPVVAAWYPDGKDDPHLTMVRFDADDGRVWVSDKGAIGFGYEVLKANMTKSIPDAGGVADVKL